MHSDTETENSDAETDWQNLPQPSQLIYNRENVEKDYQLSRAVDDIQNIEVSSIVKASESWLLDNTNASDAPGHCNSQSHSEGLKCYPFLPRHGTQSFQ